MSTTVRGAGGEAAGALDAGWSRSVGYQVYLRSFADADGDGIGDLPGLRDRLEHIAELGADVVWVTPFYPSPMADFGYDVAGYCDVDPLFGTLADADALFARARELGLRVLLDLVANHTSSAHPWFQDALRGRDAAHRDWYVWADPAPDGGPPNNWVSYFGGPAWTLDAASGQYYLHLFLPEQPDLNWANPAVADAMDGVLRFWLERGASGFRIDVAQGYVKDAALRSNPELAPLHDAMTPREAWAAFEHRHDIDQHGNVEIFRRFRRLADGYGALLVGEVYLTDAAQVARYVEDALHLAHYFAPMQMPWEPAAIRATLAQAVDTFGERVGWVSSSHDDPRAASRFGGGERGRRRALALTTLYAGLPGMPFLYQGEELGLEQVVIPPERLADPVAVRAGDLVAGRDGQRAPLPWSPDGHGRGFTTGVPWLPFGPSAPGLSVAEQAADAASPLARYRELLAVRRELPVLDGVPVEWLDGAPGLVAYRRGPLVVAVNAGEAPLAVPQPPGAAPVFGTLGDDGLLAPDNSVILLLAECG